MVIFHSYVSLPEGRWSQVRLVSKVACTHRFRVWNDGGVNLKLWPGKIPENDDKPSKLGPLCSDKPTWKYMKHDETWNHQPDWLGFFSPNMSASKWLYQCWINAHDERPTINLDMFSGFGLIKKLYDKLQYMKLFTIFI